MNKKYLFIVGLPRSGTTGFTKLLNSNPNFCIGVERYKFIKLKRFFFNESLFHKNKFFEINDGNTNFINEKLQNKLKVKFDRSKYIGDKIPNLYFELHIIYKNFENPLFLCLVRNPINVAMSWHKRANNHSDLWPLENDHIKYFEYLKKFYNYYHLYIHNKDLNIYFIHYDILEGDYDIASKYYLKILNLLGLNAETNEQNLFKKFHDKQTQLKLVRNEYHELNNNAKDEIFKQLRNLHFDPEEFFKKISL